MGSGIANAASVQIGQSTPTMQITAAIAGSRARRVAGWKTPTRRKRRTKAKTTRKRRAKSTARRSRKARLVKGSAAAKRHMARLRRMRKRR